jgi:hypothetical protein
LFKQKFESMHKVFKMRPLIVGLIHKKRKQGKEW